MMPIAVQMRILFSLLLLHVAAYAQDGFISLDCGSPQGSNYTHDGLNYVSDDGFIDGGETHAILPIINYTQPLFNTLRSFPKNERNCYTLRPHKGRNNRYLIRPTFFYANYDSRGQAAIFDLYVGADYWVTVNITDPYLALTPEMIHLTSSDYIHICLVNTGHGYPFITALELRLLDLNMYKEQPRSLILFDRFNFGTDTDQVVRYEDDKYDRKWYPKTLDGCRAVQTSDTVSLGPYNDEQIPSKVMSTAITPTNSTGSIDYSWDADATTDEFMIFLHLAEVEQLESNQSREVNIYVNEVPNGPFPVSTNMRTIRNVKDPYTGESNYKLKVDKTLTSTLPPILNALEIYTLKQLLQNQTDDQDASAIWSAKLTYGLITLNWQGDPCVPKPWVGLNRTYDAPGAAKVTLLNLSSRGLSGGIAPSLANLTWIESLDLSYNNLTGNVPKFLAQLDNLKILNLTGNNLTRPFPEELLTKSKKGTLWLSIEESSGEESSGGESRNDKHKIVFILAPIIGFIMVLSLVVFLVKQLNKKANKALIETEDGFTLRKQRYTYSEVLSITKNFQNEIGRGGFGGVFYGCVGDKQVAVKMLSESSSQGYKEFQAEVKLLMEIHHTNITSLVRYCNDSGHKGIIYNFMANGNLEKHLFGNLDVVNKCFFPN